MILTGLLMYLKILNNAGCFCLIFNENYKKARSYLQPAGHIHNPRNTSYYGQLSPVSNEICNY